MIFIVHFPCTGPKIAIFGKSKGKSSKMTFFSIGYTGNLKVPNPPNLGLYPFPTDFEGGDRFLAKVKSEI